METFVELVRSVLGSPPVGFEFLEYVICAFLLFFVCFSIFYLLSAVFRQFGGK